MKKKKTSNGDRGKEKKKITNARVPGGHFPPNICLTTGMHTCAWV